MLRMFILPVKIQTITDKTKEITFFMFFVFV
jgi:hypothetical protein